MIIMSNILDFVQVHKNKVNDLLMNQKIYTMLDMLKKAGFEEELKELSKIDFLDMIENIRDILEVPCDKVQEDIFELTMMVDVLLLRISNMTGLDTDKIDSLSLLNIFGSYDYVKLYLENQFNVLL